MSDVGQVLKTSDLPDIALRATDGGSVSLSKLAGLSVVYAYPRTSPPGAPPLAGWDDIPGARGCTPQSCGFRDHHAALLDTGADRVFGLSTQSSVYQSEVVQRLHLPFSLLSDETLDFATALGMPVFDAAGMTLMKRMTLLIRAGQIAHVFYPVERPAENAEAVVAFLNGQRKSD